MNSKKWLKIFISTNIVFLLLAVLIIKYFHIQGVPYRFTNSISYDAKLNFLRDSKILDSANIIVIGSSMGLSNIDSQVLENNIEGTNKVANLSSWGLQTSEVLELLKVIDLKKIKYIIYPTQYMDFVSIRSKNIKQDEIKDFVYNDNILTAYVNTLNSLISNFKSYINWKNEYLNKDSYRYLNFDKNGDVNLSFGKDFIDKKRWSVVNEVDPRVNKENYNKLVSIKKLADSFNTELIVVTTPFRQKLLGKYQHVFDTFTSHNKVLHQLSQKYSFKYMNLHEIMNLNDDYFEDQSHLNDKGAYLVSKEILFRMKKTEVIIKDK